MPVLNCIAGCMRTVFSTRWHGLRVARTVEEVLISLARTAILSTGCSNAEKHWSRPSSGLTISWVWRGIRTRALQSGNSPGPVPFEHVISDAHAPVDQ